MYCRGISIAVICPPSITHIVWSKRHWILRLWICLLLQLLQCCWVDRVIHHKQDVREEQKYICMARASNNKRDCDTWSLLFLAATVWSFAHMLLGIFNYNKMVLWTGCGGRAEFSLHTKKVGSVWFVVKRKGCCCNLSSGVALLVWFTTNGMCAKNKNIYAWREQAIIRESAIHDLCCYLLSQCEALRICRSGVPITILWTGHSF